MAPIGGFRVEQNGQDLPWPLNSILNTYGYAATYAVT